MSVFVIRGGGRPKFGAVVAVTPGGVLGGITLVLYGIIAGIGNLAIRFTDTFSITGIAAGTLILLIGYHVCHLLAPAHLREPAAAKQPVADPELR